MDPTIIVEAGKLKVYIQFLLGLYSMIIGFIFAAATIWNVDLRFLQSFAWLIGAFVSYFTYYLLASD